MNTNKLKKFSIGTQNVKERCTRRDAMTTFVSTVKKCV